MSWSDPQTGGARLPQDHRGIRDSLPLLTTVDRVRNRMGFTTSDLTDPIIEEFIADQQAFLEDTLDKTFTDGDDGFELARSVVTDLSAMMALVRLTGGTTSGLDYKIGKLDVEKGGQLENRLRVIFELKVRAREGLAILERDARKHRMFTINGVD